MLIRSKKNGKIYDVIYSAEVPEGFEKVAEGGTAEKSVQSGRKAKGATKVRGGAKKSAKKGEKAEEGESVAVKESEAGEADIDDMGVELATSSDGEEFEWVEVDKEKEEG